MRFLFFILYIYFFSVFYTLSVNTQPMGYDLIWGAINNFQGLQAQTYDAYVTHLQKCSADTIAWYCRNHFYFISMLPLLTNWQWKNSFHKKQGSPYFPQSFLVPWTLHPCPPPPSTWPTHIMPFLYEVQPESCPLSGWSCKDHAYFLSGPTHYYAGAIPS